MTINQLEYALTLEQKGSFRKAADYLGISQPALSLQIQKLEEEVGIILFDRSSSPITPTTDGKIFLGRSEEIVSNIRNLRSFAEDLSKDLKGRLTIGVIPTLAPFLVPLFIESLQQDYPEFELDIQELITEQVLQGVRDGTLDAGLISTPVQVHGIKVKPLFYEKFFFYTSDKLPQKEEVTISNVDYSELWILNEGNCFRDQINDFCDINSIRKYKKYIYRSNSIDALIRIVDNSGGLTILPELTTLSLSGEQENRLNSIEKKAREIGLITRQIDYKHRFIEKLEEYILKNIPKGMTKSTNLEIVDPGIQFV